MRFGLIGCGGIGRLRAAALNRSAPLRLVAVTDVQPERAAAIASNYGGVIDEDWRGLLSRGGGGGGVASNPPSLHARLGIATFGSGETPFLEKTPGWTPPHSAAGPAPPPSSCQSL